MSKLEQGMSIGDIARFWGMPDDEDVASRIVETVGDILEKTSAEMTLDMLESLAETARRIPLADVREVLNIYRTMVEMRCDLQDLREAAQNKIKEKMG